MIFGSAAFFFFNSDSASPTVTTCMLCRSGRSSILMEGLRNAVRLLCCVCFGLDAG